MRSGSEESNGVGRPDVAAFSRLVVANLVAERAGDDLATEVDAAGTVTRTPRDAAELVPGDAEAIAATADEIVRRSGKGVHARLAVRAHRQLAVDTAALRGRADDLYERAGSFGVGRLLLGDGPAMSAWLDAHPADRATVEGLIGEAIQLRLEWVGVHDAFVGNLEPLREAWAVRAW